MVRLRTVQEVLDLKTGKVLDAEEFFEFQPEDEIIRLRHVQQDAFHGRGDVRFHCLECEVPVSILGSNQFKQGGRRLRWHFKHFRDAMECPYNTGKLTSGDLLRLMKYNGAKEGAAHKETKALLTRFLHITDAVTDVKAEKRVTNTLNLRKWRRPDIQAHYKNFHIAFEAQISTEFVSVILDRAHFYHEQGMHLIWVMRTFSTESTDQLLTQKDIIHSNNMNVFVLDDDAIQLSEERNELILHCFFREPEKHNGTIIPKWQSKFINLSELNFAENSQQVFLSDYNSKYNELKQADRIERVDQYFSPYSEKYSNIRNDRAQIAKYVRIQSEITSLMALFAYADMPLHSAIASLFENGYQHSKIDRDFIKKFYQLAKNEKEEAGDTASVFDCLTFTSYYIRVQDAKLSIHHINRVRGILDSLASLKHKTVIGLNYKKLVQVAHQMFDSRTDYFALFVKGIKKYGLTQILEGQDKKGLWRRKLLDFENNLYTQSSKHNELIKAVFPDLLD